ncbi:SDR family NAD(P)-dependent oxidoreductase [Anianabacter salinae]|uniref:SDR family NAD(P)-dependent oxidoreductase n=1 Tax=Anianabacter salinae TaxID=2851023 RepID=UPI00225E6F2E|nr:SDR family oxidoreductase [Anianabacter salinae]MBV0911710.1 SDR family oxidoreductase [Anianabacter salinae]
MRLAGLTALITGAGGGFGQAAARRFAAEGARLALSDIGPIDTEGLPEGTLTARLDVTDDAAWAAHMAEIARRFGRLDVAVNNAGIGGTMAPIQHTSPEDFDRIMAVNARGTFLGLRHQIPAMADRGGAIVNIASAAGLVGAGQLAAYAASKHAVIGLTKSAADETARKGIRVNALCPSFAATPLFDAMADAVAARHDTDRAAAYDRIAARIPMRRVAVPKDILEALLLLADPANSFMTGQALAVDGGLTAV